MTNEEFRNAKKRAEKYLKTLGLDLTSSTIGNLVANIYGFPNYNTIKPTFEQEKLEQLEAVIGETVIGKSSHMIDDFLINYKKDKNTLYLTFSEVGSISGDSRFEQMIIISSGIKFQKISEVEAYRLLNNSMKTKSKIYIDEINYLKDLFKYLLINKHKNITFSTTNMYSLRSIRDEFNIKIDSLYYFVDKFSEEKHNNLFDGFEINRNLKGYKSDILIYNPINNQKKQDNINFKFKAIVGKTGSGKTTYILNEFKQNYIKDKNTLYLTFGNMIGNKIELEQVIIEDNKEKYIKITEEKGLSLIKKSMKTNSIIYIDESSYLKMLAELILNKNYKNLVLISQDLTSLSYLLNKYKKKLNELYYFHSNSSLMEEIFKNEYLEHFSYLKHQKEIDFHTRLSVFS